MFFAIFHDFCDFFAFFLQMFCKFFAKGRSPLVCPHRRSSAFVQPSPFGDGVVVVLHLAAALHDLQRRLQHRDALVAQRRLRRELRDLVLLQRDDVQQVRRFRRLALVVLQAEPARGGWPNGASSHCEERARASDEKCESVDAVFLV